MGSYTYWIEAGKEYDAAKAYDKQAPVCTDSSLYTHWYAARESPDEPGAYEYDDFTCRELGSVERYMTKKALTLS